MKNETQLRIGNISFENNENNYEILKYEPNPYFGKEEDFNVIKVNSVNGLNNEIFDVIYAYYSKDNTGKVLDKSCFLNKEICSVIASFKVENNEIDIIWCSNEMPLKLNKDDWKDFIECVKFGFSFIDKKK